MITDPQQIECPHRDIVVMATSTGGVLALSTVLPKLPPDFGASVFAVMHMASDARSALPTILARRTRLPVTVPADDEVFESGHIYLAKPNHHLVIEGPRVRHRNGPRENRARPAADPLFRTAAQSWGPRVIGVVLTGALDDGTAGLAAVAEAGGATVVQDPESAEHPGMPESAAQYVDVDHVVPLEEVGPTLERLVREPLPEPALSPDPREKPKDSIAAHEQRGELVPITCPDCGGPLWRDHGSPPRFRCHTGHTFGPLSLLEGTDHGAEQALWSALRILEERVRFLERLEAEYEKKNLRAASRNFRERADEHRGEVEMLRSLLDRYIGCNKSA